MTPFTTAWYKEQCEQLRIYPEKQRGQHFLIDTTIPKKMIDAARLTARDTVIEIGPGFGPLTIALAQTPAAVRVYEIEQKFAATPVIAELIARRRIEFHHADILETDETTLRGNYHIISNLPYRISSAVIVKFLTSRNPPASIMLMLQKEVVEKLMAKPPRMTRLAVLAQATSAPRVICAVPRRAFWPQPSVDSAVVHLANIAQPKNLAALQKITEAGFASKRKKLINNLKAISHNPASLPEAAHIGPNVRAEEIDTAAWLRMADAYDASKK